ncbi:MAG: type II toxin-antitoxin system HicB family antitoxin [Chloroflexota bacterium]|nr:type II toxin-antitoxin system HicB family antitoxin [Chloroflexota bacterium]
MVTDATFTITPDVEALATRPYAAILTREDDEYVFRVPELPGLMTGGATLEEAYALLEDAKRAWIATALELGRPIPDPRDEDAPRKSGRFSVRVAPAIHTALAEEAERQGVSLNDLVSGALAIVAARGFDQIVRNTEGR